MREVPTVSDDAPILVVDDDPKILQLVRMYLEREGFLVATSADGLAAVAAIRERQHHRQTHVQHDRQRGAAARSRGTQAAHKHGRSAEHDAVSGELDDASRRDASGCVDLRK